MIPKISKVATDHPASESDRPRASCKNFGPQSNTAKRTVIHNYDQVAEEFEQQVNKMLEDIFNENIPFRQAEDEDMCEYCDFKKICQR